MSADFNHPIPTDAYVALLDELRAQSALNAQMFAGSLTGVSNLPTNTIRWNPTSKIFESWSGSAWAALSDVYHIIVDSVSNPGVIPDGTLAAPGLRFALELGSGLYRAGASDVRLALSGVDAWQANGADGTRFTYAGDGSSISFTRTGSLIGRLMATSTAAVLSNGAKLNAAASGWITETANLGQISLQQTAMIARGAEAQTVGAATGAMTTWFTADKNGVYAGAAGSNKLATETYVGAQGYLTSASAASTYIPLSQKAAASGVASLNSSTKVPIAQLSPVTGGVFAVNATGDVNYSLDVQTQSAGGKGIRIRGQTSQSAALQEWANVGGSVLAEINASGQLLCQSFESGAPCLASITEMRTGTDTTKIVAPGTQRYHPYSVKAWGALRTDGVFDVGAGISSITDAGTGSIGVTWNPSFTSTYSVVASAQYDAAGGTSSSLNVQVQNTNFLNGSCIIVVTNATGAAIDPNRCHIMAIGPI